MKYMLMMHAPAAGWTDAGSARGRPRTSRAHIEFMKDFTKELTEAGELVGAEGLAGPEEAQGRAGADGRRARGDRRTVPRGEGVPRRLLDRRRATTPAQAYEIAARASAAPGTGGVPLNMPIEVRQVMSAPPVDV